MRRKGSLAIHQASGTVHETAHSPFVSALLPKFLLATALLFLAHHASSHTLRADDKVAGWQHDFAAAEAQAKTQQLALVVHFHASWCGPCRRMESEVLSNVQVTSLLGNGIIGVKVDSDRHRDLVSRFGVRALPTDVIVSPDGKVLAKDVGSPGLAGYVARLKQHLQTPATPTSAVAAAPAQTPPPVPAEPAEPAKTAAPATAPATAPAENPVAAAEPPTKPATPAETATPAVAATPAETAAPAKTNEPPAADNDPKPPEVALTPEEVAAALRDQTKLIIRRDNTRIGLGGFSPVAHSANASWVAGQQEFALEFQGVRYLLASATELEQFKAAPEKFIPALHGCDPVALIRDQKVQSGFVGLRAEHASRVFFFTTPENRELFLREPEKFSTDRRLVFFQAEAPANKS
ncbi:MAG: thioredoxin domain-containing protein [Planctomycetaceae bacterium]